MRERHGERPPPPTIDELYLKRELGAAHCGEPPGMVYQNELPSGANASVSVWRLPPPSGALVVVKRFSLSRTVQRGGERGVGLATLLNEVKLYHSLRHRHLVRFHGAFVSRGDLCIGTVKVAVLEAPALDNPAW